MSNETLKQRLLSIMDGLAERGMGPFEIWAHSPGVTPERARALLRADLKQAFMSAYGGEKVVQALIAAGLTELLRRDLRRVVGAARADQLIGGFDGGESSADRAPSRAPPAAGRARPKSSRPSTLAVWLGVIGLFGVGAFLPTLAYHALVILGCGVLLIGLVLLFVRDFRTVGFVCLAAFVGVMGVAGAIEPRSSKPGSIEASGESVRERAPDAEGRVSNTSSLSGDGGGDYRPYRPSREEQCGRAGRLATRLVYGKDYRDNQYQNLESIGYCPN